MSFKDLLCRFFQQGSCAYGDGCLYSHDPDRAVPIPADTCIFFLRLNCMYGENCSRKHQTIEEIIEQHLNSDNNQQNKINESQQSENNNNDNDNDDVQTLNKENQNKSNVESVEKSSDKNIDTLVFSIGTITVSDAIPSTSHDESSNSSKSYASAAQNGCGEETDESRASLPLCTFFQSHGFCVYQNCRSIHGELCDLCGFYSLNPYNKQQSNLHRSECIKEHEESMEISFAFARSKELTCAICLDVVVDKEPRSHRRFGILENCSHVYCIECIRKWRNAKDMDTKNKRNCPQCRVKSDFIIPSQYFYDDQEQKSKLIEQYKKALGAKHCKYFKRGRGTCPFEGACFYKHQNEDGTMAVLPKPKKNRRQGERLNLASVILFDNDFDFHDDFSDSDMDLLDFYYENNDIDDDDDDDYDDDWENHL